MRGPTVHRGRGASALLAVCALIASPADALPPAPAAPAATAPVPIPIDRIAPRAAEIARELGDLANALAPDPEIAAIRAALPAAQAALTQELERTLLLLERPPSLETLQAQALLWQQRQLHARAWLDTLTRRVAQLQKALERLDSDQAVWTRTREVQQAAQSPDIVLERIDETLAAIAAMQPLARAQRDAALALQDQATEEVVRGETARTRIARLEQGIVGGTLARDSQPIWSPVPWAQAGAALPGRIAQIAAAVRADVRAYLSDPARGLPLQLLVLLVTFAAMLAARRQIDRLEAGGERLPRLNAVFDRPFAAALLIALIAATAIAAPTPFAVKRLLGALAMVPLLVLARPLSPPTLVPALYGLGILFALDTLRYAFGGLPPLVDQVMLLLESLAGILLLLWLRRHAGASSVPPRLRRLALGLMLAALAIGQFASLFGYLALARVTTPAVLVGAVDALWLYAAVEVGIAVVAYVLRVWPLAQTYMVQHRRRLLETRTRRGLIWIAIATWAMRYLSYLGLWEPALAQTEVWLAAPIVMGSFATTPGDLLAFAATLAAGYLLSALLRFVLQEEIYPRTGLAPGVSYAASSVIHYAILVVSLLLALGFLGITLTQVTVLAGALGIGIGLGLQGVVNNFVSGLILLFERPINVGDAVQTGDLQGTVRRIGIRASVVRTAQGAEIIVPNAQLISQQVTNWTLSDRQRRIDLPVGLAYGTAPAAAIALLESVAHRHPKVLAEPPPHALFKGYSDSAADFELRAWTDYASATDVQSDLTAAVYEAASAAGFGFPQPSSAAPTPAAPAR